MARIACGHCGSFHNSVAEVRACALDGSAPADAPTGGAPTRSGSRRRNPAPPRSTAAAAPSRPRPTAPMPVGVTADALAGPLCLGRSVVLRPDQETPAPWTGCREVTAGPDADELTLHDLHRAWRQREPLVIRWLGGDTIPPAGPLDVPFHQLAPDTDLPGERLHFALTANAVILLADEPLFEPWSLALAAGAGPAAPDGDGAGELAGPNGPIWADGGPFDLDLASHPDLAPAGLVPRVHLLARSLRPLTVDGPAGSTDDGGDPGADIDLADDQRAAVLHAGGPARILAPAGSGKTRVLTERVRHLVERRGVEPTALTLVAYNRRARAEMTQRLADLDRTRPDSIRTLNSLALAISTGRSGFVGGTSATTIDERDMRRILGRMIPSRRRRQLTDPLEPWVDALSISRLGLLHPDEAADRFGGDLDGFGDVLEQYRSHLFDRNLLDFDEQILRAVELLVSNPEARATARRLTPIILIDEFQDLTPAHLLLIRLLAGPADEVFAVGDDDQTIYGYTGASPRWLVDFDHYFGDPDMAAGSYFLTTNYRCPPDVVQAAVNLLSHNRHRVPKTIRSAAHGDEADNPGRPGDTEAGTTGLTVHRTGDPQDNLVSTVTDLVGCGVAPEAVAVLARVNAALLPAFLHLDHAGVPVARPAGVQVDMLDRSGAGAALAWLRLATTSENGLADDDLRLALRRPPRSLHPRIVDWVCEQPSVQQLRRLSERLNTERDAASVAGLADDIETLRSLADSGADTETLLSHILNEIGLLGAAAALDGSQRTARRAAHSDELLALVAVASLQPDPAGFEPWLRDRLTVARPSAEPDLSPRPGTDSDPAGNDHEPSTGGAVTLATVHTTKGLEWPHVIVHDVRDGLYPHRLSEDPEEERRIFHVAITRGRESVTVTCSGPRSPFVAELEQARTGPWPEITEDAGAGGAGGPGKARSTGTGQPKRADPATENEARLRESLTRWRRQRAKDDQVPAYVVLNNKTLDAIAAAEPATLADLARVPGIGPSRLDQYGDEILGIIADPDP